MVEVCVAFKAHQGWAAASALARLEGRVRPLAALRMQIVDPGDRSVAEPYHVAGGWDGLERVPPPADPEAVIERAAAKQFEGAQAALTILEDTLADQGWNFRRAVLLTRRGVVHDLAESWLLTRTFILRRVTRYVAHWAGRLTRSEWTGSPKMRNTHRPSTGN